MVGGVCFREQTKHKYFFAVLRTYADEIHRNREATARVEYIMLSERRIKIWASVWSLCWPPTAMHHPESTGTGRPKYKYSMQLS
jgi:hypothetical protein